MTFPKNLKVLFLLFTAVLATENPKNWRDNLPSRSTVKKTACLCAVSALAGAFAGAKLYDAYTNYDSTRSMEQICQINQNDSSYASYLVKSYHGEPKVAYAMLGGVCARVDYDTLVPALANTCKSSIEYVGQTVRQWVSKYRCSEDHAKVQEKLAKQQREAQQKQREQKFERRQQKDQQRAEQKMREAEQREQEAQRRKEQLQQEAQKRKEEAQQRKRDAQQRNQEAQQRKKQLQQEAQKRKEEAQQIKRDAQQRNQEAQRRKKQLQQEAQKRKEEAQQRQQEAEERWQELENFF